jgi:hypothetical protein
MPPHLQEGIKEMSAIREGMERLRAEVREIESATDSALTFISGLANRLREALMGNSNDDDDTTLAAEISALADELNAQGERLAAAITANTLADDDSDSIPAASDEEPSLVFDPPVSEEPAASASSGAGVESEMIRSGEGVTGQDSAVDTQPAGNESEIAEDTGGEPDLMPDTESDTSENADENGQPSA